MTANTITFIVTEDESRGSLIAQAKWPDVDRSIRAEAADRDELVRNIRETLATAFGESEPKPQVVHLHFVRDETFSLSPSNGKEAYPLRGKPYRFDDPFSPIGVEDWEALK
jgi:hypothetical protein